MDYMSTDLSRQPFLLVVKHESNPKSNAMLIIVVIWYIIVMATQWV